MNRKALIWVAVGLGALALCVPLGALAASMKSGSGTTPTTQRGSLAANVAKIEGVSPATLRRQMRAGESLFQIANGKYTSTNGLASALLSRFKGRLARVAGRGTITNAQAQAFLNRINARVTRLAGQSHPLAGMLKRAKAVARMSSIRRENLKMAASTCNTTPTALKAAFKAGGQTPLAICQATNPSITESGLVSSVMSQIKSTLDSLVATYPKLAEYETQILTMIQNRLTTLLTTALPTHS